MPKRTVNQCYETNERKKRFKPDEHFNSIKNSTNVNSNQNNTYNSDCTITDNQSNNLDSAMLTFWYNYMNSILLHDRQITN